MPRPYMRVIIPKKPEEVVTLSEKIIVKHTADGVNSPLSFLDMDDMEAQTILARAKVTLAVTLNAQKEVAIQLRDNALGINAEDGTVGFYIKASREILLGFYKGSETELSVWGFDIRRTNQDYWVNLPVNAKIMIELAQAILAKNTLEGVDSPIKGLDIVDFTAKTATAFAQNNLAEKYLSERIAAITDRDKLCGFGPKQFTTTEGTIRFYVTQVRDVLLGLKKGYETHLGDWGFDVQTSPKPKPGKKSLSGKVSDEEGEVLNGVLVKIPAIPVTVYTNSIGYYAFGTLTAGTYTVEFSKSGYIMKTVPNIVITEGDSTTLNTSLTASGGTLIVTVYSEGVPLAEAVVSIVQTGAQKITEAEGVVTFTNVPAGDYDIQAVAPGKQLSSKPVTITNGVIEMIDFNLLPE